MAGDNPTIPGILVPPHVAQGLQKYVAQMVGRTNPLFPGSQPVSFTRTDSLPQLLTSDYLVCEKSDGVRVLALMIVSDQGQQPLTYFITRKNEYYQAPSGVCFPVPNNFSQFHHQTLIDAELVIDTDRNGQKTLTLLGFDALVVNGARCMERTLEKRLGYLNEHVLAPYRQWYRQQNQQPPLNVAAKIFERSYGLDKLYRETIPSLQHKSDGVIFTSVQAPYQIGTCPYIIKWKPSNENSVDFKLRISNGALRLLVWQGRSQYSEFGALGASQQDIHTMLREANVGSLEQLDGLIVEALYDPLYMPPAHWRFMRFRDDKPHGNHASVVEKIMVSINDNMELEELLQSMDQIRTAWKQRNP